MLSTATKTGAASASADTAADQQAAAATADNRKAVRRPAAAVPEITGLRISPHGVEATLVNISESGCLAECGERLKPGSSVTVVFEGSFTPRTMEGRVARNSVSSMGADGRLRYHVGISFGRPIQLPELPPEETPPVEAADPAPTPAASDPSEAAAPSPLLAAVARALEAEAAASTPAPVSAAPPVAPAPVASIAATPASPAPADSGSAAESDAAWAQIVIPQAARNRW